MSNLSQQQLVAALQLKPHPEGGYYKEMYRSAGAIPPSVLGANFSTARNFCTGIYFMLAADSFSAFHRIQQDEIWHFHMGTTIELHWLSPKGKHHKIHLGHKVLAGEKLQAVVPAGCWFAAKSVGPWALVGCTVAPGFNFADFELANRQELVKEFPQHKELIENFTR